MVSNEKGFTLIEMIIVIAVMSIFSAMALAILLSGAKFFEREKTIANNQEITRYVTRTIGKEIRRAEQVICINDYTIQIIYEDLSESKFVHIDDKIIRFDKTNLGVESTHELSKGIKQFKVTKDPTTDPTTGTIELDIASKDKPKGSSVRMKSKFNLRKKAV